MRLFCLVQKQLLFFPLNHSLVRILEHVLIAIKNWSPIHCSLWEVVIRSNFLFLTRRIIFINFIIGVLRLPVPLLTKSYDSQRIFDDQLTCLGIQETTSVLLGEGQEFRLGCIILGAYPFVLMVRLLSHVFIELCVRKQTPTTPTKSISARFRLIFKYFFEHNLVILSSNNKRSAVHISVFYFKID